MNQELKDRRELLAKPGDTIAETLEHFKMSQAQLAERMGKTAPKINDIISGKEPITMSTALQLEKVLGIDAQFWLNSETSYREKLSRIEQEEELEKYLDWSETLPVPQLRKCGYLKSKRKGVELVQELLQFFGVVSPEKWEAIYVADYAKTSFRKSEAHQTELGSMSSWLRIGEIEMRKIELPEFNKVKFRKCLTGIKQLVINHPDNFARDLKNKCQQAGVAVIYTMCLPGAPVSGATRWIGGNPLIQLTDRYKSNDHFWFTFYHEAGHILLHGKKEIFIESFKGYHADREKEKEADEFASDWLLPEDFIEKLHDDQTELTTEDIEKIAEEYKTHPAVVIGRLQHLGKIPFSVGAEFKIKVDLSEHFNEKERK